jgi:hypothetical protein
MKLEANELTPAEQATADKWIAKHQPTCSGAAFEYGSVVSGYGYRIRVYCTTCGAREDITEIAKRDPAPPR